MNTRFRIAFAFAGEKRSFVSQIAGLLATELGKKRILYDKYHDAEFAIEGPVSSLSELYHNETDLIVAVFCPHYDTAEWCGLEGSAIYDLIKQGRSDQVMLTRFEHQESDGQHGLTGFIDIDQKTPEEVVELILERLTVIDQRRIEEHAARAAWQPRPAHSTTPNNLPSLLPFFGRESELALLRDALDPTSRTWGTLIGGGGGIGKTSLAVRAAYDCPPGQFRRIIFLSFKTCEMDETGDRRLAGGLLPGILELFNQLARELGQPDITKAPEDQRIRLLLDALRPAHALLILDNLESLPKADRDRLLTFVKHLPLGCKALLTSRRRIGSGTELLMLEKLDLDAALATLADLAQHNRLLARTSDTERVSLYTQTGGNPLLLRWVARQLGRGNFRTFADALHLLHSCPPDTDPLAIIFDQLAHEFSPEETQILCALTYLNPPGRIEHIAILAGLQKELVEIILHLLANRSIVVPDQDETAFSLLPMVVGFLRDKWPDLIAATGHHLEQVAYALIEQHSDSAHHPFPVLSTAWPLIAPALPLFLTGDNARLQTVCDSLRFFLDATGRWDERLALNEQAEVKANAFGDHLKAGWRAYHAGVVHRQHHNAAAVLACADRAAAHWQATPTGDRERAIAIRLRGNGHELNQHYPAAIAAYLESLELRRSLEADSVDVAIALNDLAGAEQLSQDFDAAERDFTEALRIVQALDNTDMMAGISLSLAELVLARQQALRATESLPFACQPDVEERLLVDC